MSRLSRRMRGQSRFPMKWDKAVLLVAVAIGLAEIAYSIVHW